MAQTIQDKMRKLINLMESVNEKDVHNPNEKKVMRLYNSSNEFIKAYVESIFFTNEDELHEKTIQDFSLETMEKIISDCNKFLEQCESKKIDFADKNVWDSRTYDAEQIAGHDFWFTRNHHGSGFWDGDWKKPYGDMLTNIATSFSEVNVYIGDDGLIHID